MVKVCKNGVWILKGREIIEDCPENQGKLKKLRVPAGGDLLESGRRGTIAARILLAHHESNSSSVRILPKELKLKFDALASHDIPFADVIQNAEQGGLEEFPVPYVFTSCPGSSGDHALGISAARRYGGIYVPPHVAALHSYIRETLAASGKMILGSDNRARYGALGSMGAGGGGLARQLFGQRCDIPWPQIIAVYLTGKPRRGVGPQDIALALAGAVHNDGFAKNAVLEFLGDGIAELSADFRLSIDAMTAETGSWSSVWETDETVRRFFAVHARERDYKKLAPAALAYYNGMIYVDLSAIKPMIALPFRGGIVELDTFLSNPGGILHRLEKEADGADAKHLKQLADTVDSQGRIRVDRAVVAGCVGGTFDNLMALRSILENRAYEHNPGNAFSVTLYPASQPVFIELARNDALASLISRGASVCACGPCSDADDTNGISVRHGRSGGPAFLMDARSIAAAALNGGWLTSIESIAWEERISPYRFDPAPYLARVYNGAKKLGKTVER